MNSPKSFTYETIILERHLDNFGHVNNAKYLELIEEARWDLLTRTGWGLHEVKARNEGPVVLDLSIRFRRELMLRESIKIVTDVGPLKRKIFVLRQSIFNQRGELAAEAQVTLGLFDMVGRKLIEPSADWKNALGLS